MSKLQSSIVGLSVVIVAALPLAGKSGEVDWNKAKGTDLTVFYPGQSSWEWILTKSGHEGAPDIRKGKRCWDCHEGDEKDMGSDIVSGGPLEPDPIPGERPTFVVNVKAAHDGENLYVRLAWPEAKKIAAKKEDPEYAAKATILIGDKSLVAFERGGCWSVCHDDLIGMPSAKGHKLTKYLTESRTKITRQGGGESYKSEADLAKLLANGTFVEFWQARLTKEGSATPNDGYILDKIHKSDPPMISVQGALQDGQWVVVLSRKLSADGTGRRKIEAGKVIPIGIAIHDNYTTHRHHHVAFRRTLALDKGDADIIAAKQ